MSRQRISRVHRSRSRRAMRERHATSRVRLASLTVLRAQSGSLHGQSWIQDVNDCFTTMFRNNPRTTFADALHAYANQLEGYQQTSSSSYNSIPNMNYLYSENHAY